MEQKNNSRQESFKLKAELNKKDMLICRLEGRVSSLERQLKKSKGFSNDRKALGGERGATA